MARGALSRSRRLAGVGKTNNLLLIFTLLSLLWPANSWMDKKDLGEIKENIKKLQHDAATRKAVNMVDYAFIPGLLEDATKLMDLLNKMSKKALPDFLPFHEFLQDIKGFLGEVQVFMNKEFKNEIVKIENYEDKLAQLESLTTNSVEEKADL